VSRPVIVRPAARVVLLDEQDRILLFRFVSHGGHENPGRSVWITPGGGLEPGETFEEGARRELWEETGLSLDPGPQIWRRTHRMTFNGAELELQERYFLVRTAACAVDRTNWTPEEHLGMLEDRWWEVDAIARNEAREYFAPRRLAELLRPLLLGKLPAEPIDTGT
jgi:8-oxo-dGTP pyrophosphatase MutT (NUDIX family)